MCQDGAALPWKKLAYPEQSASGFVLLPFDKLRINFIFDEGRNVDWQALRLPSSTPAFAGEPLCAPALRQAQDKLHLR